jgi:HK97 family phage prohead protease/HK97 family phage major capsid protein
MEKILHIASTFKSHESDDGGVMIRGMASTNHSDRAGDVIAAEAWTKGGLQNFQNNPVILFNHDYDKPIGRATGVKVTDSGLELEAKISKAAPANVAQLVKDGVLGAFSVGFKVKDADYIKETDGLMIKDAELFEVSVVSVPCNQAATFSLAKSFDSIDEYNEFKKTFTNRVDLTGQSLTKDDSKESKVVSDAPKQVEKSTIKETKMSEETKTPEIDLEAFAKKVADETAAKIAMKQAEEKAAAKAEVEAKEAQALEAKKIETSIKSGIETGVEKLMSDFAADAEKAKSDDIAEVVAQYEKDLKEKGDEIEAMRNSKRNFSNRTADGDLTDGMKKELLGAHIFGKVTRTGWDSDYAKGILQKAGEISFTGNSAGVTLDSAVSQAFEEEVALNLKTASFFDEIQVTGGATALPIGLEPLAADFVTGVPTTNSGLLETTESGNTYAVSSATLNAFRLVSASFLSNDTDEQMVINTLPMIQSAMARAHAKAIDKMVMSGSGSNQPNGIYNLSGIPNDTHSATLVPHDVTGGSDTVSAADVVKVRQQMGKYGLVPEDLVIIVGLPAYYDLLADANFAEISQVGDLAQRVSGQVGTLFGSPVTVTDQITGTADGNVCMYVVNRKNYVIPRLTGVNIETDYEVANQRTALVASQSLGFEQLVSGAAGSRGIGAAAYTAG